MDKYKQSFPLCNLQATRIPSYSDDYSSGYSVGSLWAFEGVISRCEDPSINNAIWVNIASSFNPTSYLAHATVDGINGDDSYAQLNNPKRPYRTINVAMDALKNAIITAISSPVQCRAFCYVKQGVYFDEYTINREYIDMHFEYGAIVISDTDGKPVISDTDGNDEPVNITITGQGQFYHTRYNPQGLDNQAIAISNSNSKEFNFEAYEIDGIQIYGGAGVTTKLNVKNTRVRFTIYLSLKKSIYFEKCKFLSGLEPNSFFHQDIEMNCNECEFILPSDDLDSLLEIRDISNNLVDIIDVSSGVASGTPFDIISGSREDLQNSHRAGHTHPMAAGIYVCNVYDTSDINFYCSITNSKIRIQKEGGIGIALIQNQEADFSDSKHPYFVFRDIHIEDETVGKTTTALVAKKLDSLTTTIPFMFASIISNCEVLEGSGYEAGYEAILPSYDFVPEGSSGGVSTFSALTDSPYDNTLLAEALDSKQDKPNGVLTGCTITLGSYGGSGSNNDIRVTEGTWRISPSEYSNVGTGNTDFLDIALSASGLQRYVELVGTTSNTIIKVEGSESEIAVRPTLGAGQVSLGSILVKDALIDPPVPDLSGYIPKTGANDITGNLLSNQSFFQVGLSSFNNAIYFLDGVYTTIASLSPITSISAAIQTYSNSNGSVLFGVSNPISGYSRQITVEGAATATPNQSFKLDKGLAYYNGNYRSEMTDDNTIPDIGRVNQLIAASSGTTNLGYTPGPTDGTVTSDTGTDATLTLVDGTNAGLVSPSMKSTWDGKQATLTDVNFGTFSAALTTKTTPVDADTTNISDNADSNKSKKVSLINLWINYLKPKADAIYATISNLSLKMDLSMPANTIKANNTGSTANASDLTTDQFTAMMEVATSVGTTGIITAITSATYKYIRLTSASATGLGSILAPSSSYKDLYIWNDTGVTLTLYHDYSSEATVANRILCGANRSWANNTMLHLKYDVVETRWCLVTLEGSTYRPLLAGTGDRLNQTSSTGQESATLTTQDIDFTPAQKTSATTGSWTGVNEITITGLKQGQYYADIAGGFNYECHVNDKCNRTPNVNLTPITTNLIYPCNEIVATSGTLIVDNAFVLNNASQVVMALPSTAAQGDLIIVNGKGAGGWKITQAASQQIVGGLTNTTTGVTGYVSAGQYASLTLKCITGGSSTVWEIVCINPATTLTIV